MPDQCECPSGTHGHFPMLCPQAKVGMFSRCSYCEQMAAKEMASTFTTDGGFFANTTATLSSVVSSPFRPSIIQFEEEVAETPPPPAVRMPDGGEAKVARITKPRAVKVTRQISINTHFKLIVFVILGLTIAAALACVALGVLIPTPTANQQSLFELTRTLTISGFSAMVGLLGGKVLK